MPNEIHSSVAFARQYGDLTDEYFNTSAAIIRLKELILDANNIKEIFDREFPHEKRWEPWFGSEIISYFSVGFVTCLEWHARSRITDLFTYKPSSIDVRDIKGTLGENILAQMIANNTTVAHLIGGSLKISSFDTYMMKIGRVLLELDIHPTAYDVIKKPKSSTPRSKEDDFQTMKYIFEYRNRLVHEISSDSLGHPNIRDAWSAEDAVKYGNVVLNIMLDIEDSLRDNAPEDFPNLVDPDGNTMPREEILMKQINILEDRISIILKEFQELIDDKSDSRSEFLNVCNEASKILSSEINFINNAIILHNRYIDLKSPLKIVVLKNRINYLKSFLQIIDNPII